MRSKNYIKIHGKDIEGNLDVLFYKNDGAIIAYAPALEIMGYGNSEEEARESFEVVLDDFFEKCLSEGTLDRCLIECGWQKHTQAEFISPNLIESAGRNKTIQKIFNLPKVTMTKESFNRPFAV